jgi:hypothetical protein
MTGIEISWRVRAPGADRQHEREAGNKRRFDGNTLKNEEIRMRPQQNRRMRGRGSNNNNNNSSSNNGNSGNQNRKGPNPLTRSYESNGPDVKIRGSAQQIAEKYTTLARDAQSAGDRVMAENYLQHAEHYNRIIMAAQAQMPQQPVRDNRDDDDSDEDGDEGDLQNSGSDDRGSQSQHNQRHDGSGPQPVIEGVPAEVALNQDAGEASGNADAGSDRGAARARGRGRGRAREEAVAEQPAQVEVGAAEQVAAPDAHAEVEAETSDEQPARKPRRPRRPRLKVGEEGEDQAASGSEETVTEAAQ